MGRTVPTFTMVLQQEVDSWGKFRRALRKEDQDAMDELFRAAQLQLAGSAYAARPIPFESIAMAMMVALQRRVRELERISNSPPTPLSYKEWGNVSANIPTTPLLANEGDINE